MRRLWAAAGCAAVLSAAAGELEAQARFGLQGSWGSDDFNFGIGARVALGLRAFIPSPGFEGVASFDYFLPEEPAGLERRYWEINGNLLYMIPNVQGNVAPYVGGGLNIAHLEEEAGGLPASDTEAGLNVLAGLKFKSPTSRVTPFLELRAEIGGGDIFVLSGGVTF